MIKGVKKIFFQIEEFLPARKRVYFIYTHKNGFDRFRNGLKANTEISYWIFRALKKEFPAVRFLRFQGEKSSRIAKIRSQDVVVGHIGPTFQEASRYTQRLIAFNPWAGHEDRSREGFNCCPKEQEMALFDRCAALVLLTSEYNKKEYFEKPRNFWHPYFQDLQRRCSIQLVHQPIDLALFKRIKWEYKTNNFLYVGNNAHMKCVEDSIRIVDAVKKKLTIYGFGATHLDHLDAGQVAKLSDQADFFIQPGMWEAQCVSILEAAARGFIPVVSPETGYPYSHPFLLKYGDYAYNVKVVKALINTNFEDRRKLADSLHSQLVSDVNHNSWKVLTDVLVGEVARLLT